MYSNTSVTLSLTVRSSVPPQVLHTSAGICTTSRRGNSGGSWRRFFFSALHGLGRLCLGVAASGSGGCGADATASAFVGFRLLQRQLELRDDALDPLGARTELLATEPGDLRLELLDR